MVGVEKSIGTAMKAADHTQLMLGWWRQAGVERADLAQRWLIARIDADPGSVSGEHLGRLAGFKNWKRGGTWVNAIAATDHGRCWLPAPALRQNEEDSRVRRPMRRNRPAPSTYSDQSESGREWGWVCGRLEAGCHPSTVYKELVERAAARRGRDTRRYAARTINRALRRLEKGTGAEKEAYYGRRER